LSIALDDDREEALIFIRQDLVKILKLLPRTNCRQCGEPTCMVFAARAAEGVKGAADCPPLSDEARQRLDGYLGRFNFDA
jgi:CO dehydrogenase/acetyl-CoA synthase gamma subunit (corrinoid Fe-S protein)